MLSTRKCHQTLVKGNLSLTSFIQLLLLTCWFNKMTEGLLMNSIKTIDKNYVLLTKKKKKIIDISIYSYIIQSLTKKVQTQCYLSSVAIFVPVSQTRPNQSALQGPRPVPHQ